jgi:hypothetical protein
MHNLKETFAFDNNAINIFLSVHEDLLIILEENNVVMKSVNNTERLIDDYEQGISERLRPKLHELQHEGDSKISLATEKCNASY